MHIEQLDSVDAVICGAVTYHGMASYMSKEKEEVADQVNSMKEECLPRN